MHTHTIESLYYASAACSTMFSGNKQILQRHSVSNKKRRYHKKPTAKADTSISNVNNLHFKYCETKLNIQNF